MRQEFQIGNWGDVGNALETLPVVARSIPVFYMNGNPPCGIYPVCIAGRGIDVGVSALRIFVAVVTASDFVSVKISKANCGMVAQISQSTTQSDRRGVVKMIVTDKQITLHGWA